METTRITALVLLALLSGCETLAEEQERQFKQDVAICSRYGAEYGSPAHYQCMMFQQQRRDYNNAVMAANANYMAAQIRALSY